MPDKRIDEKFINHAWEQMLTTLNQEMPVEEKRRRVVLVPWRLAAAASVLLLLTLGAGWWLAQRNTQAIVDSTPVVSTPVENLAAKEDCDETTNASILVQKERQPEKEAIANLEKTTVVDLKKNPLLSKIGKEKASVTPILPQIARVETQNALPIELDAIQNNTVIAEAETVAPSNQQNQSLQSLNAQHIAMLEKAPVKLEAKQKLELFGETPEEKESKSSKWNIGLELATYASAGAALDGYAGGAVVDVPVESEKINLRTGLNFNSQQRYFDSNIPMASADKGINPGFGTAVVVDPNPNFQVNAQQLSLPLTLEFKPRKSWGLEGGLQASYLLGARNLKGAEAYQTVAGFTNGNEAIRTFVNSLSKAQYDFTTNTDPMVDNSTVNIDAFRRFDVAVTAGFGYYPTQNIGVRLQYQRGLIDIIKADQFKTFGNNMRLSAVYFFGK